MRTVPLNENFSNRLETVCLGKTMGVDHGGNGTQNLELGIVPQILSCCKILRTGLLALQCRKMFFCLYFYSKSRHASPRIPVRSTSVWKSSDRSLRICKVSKLLLNTRTQLRVLYFLKFSSQHFAYKISSAIWPKSLNFALTLIVR